MKILLKTERLRLRRFVPDDAKHLFALDNDPDVMRFINGGEQTPCHIIENEILPTFLHNNDPLAGYGFFAAEELDGRAFVGWFSLRPAKPTSHDAALGYRLHKAAWGKGYATEGAQALIDNAFVTLGMERVLATTYEHNLGSRRVMEKLGMVFVRSFRYTVEDLTKSDTSHTTSLEVWDGEDVEYALSREDWVRMKRRER